MWPTPLNDPGAPWWLTNVHGPTAREYKAAYLLELRDIRAACSGPWLLCGDFNLIYMASDKNNGRLRRGLMHRFHGLLDDLHLDELHLSSRLFTWSNGRDQPTLERATIEWVEQYPCNLLRCLSSNCSNHAPLLLTLNSEPRATPRFRFDRYWRKIDGFLDVVRAAWGLQLPNADACRCLDQKLHALARALKSWRASRMGNIRLQLAAARVVVYELDVTQES